MKEWLFNKWLQIRAFLRAIFNLNFECEDGVPVLYVEKPVTFHIGHNWGLYHPSEKFYWNQLSVKYFNDNYHLYSLFYPRKYRIKSIPYNCGIIESNESFKYGYFSAEIKFPLKKGQWPGFWLFNGDNPETDNEEYSEIDIVEGYSKNGNYKNFTKFQPNVHYKENGEWKMIGPVNIPLQTNKVKKDFIKFSLLWTENKIDIFYDGILVKRITNKKVLNNLRDMHIVFSLYIEYNENPSNKAEMIVRNIKVYQYDNSK